MDRKEVNRVWIDQDLTNDYKEGWYAYEFSVNTSIHPAKYPEIKNLLERYLNGEMDNPSPLVNEGWEILAVRDTDGKLFYTDMLPTRGETIDTVRRKSDGVVFSVGDRVTYENVPAHSWENRNGCLISYFKVSGEDIYINSHDAGETLHDISEWIKLSPEPSPIQEDKLKEYFKPYDTRKTVDNTDTDLPSTVKDKDIIWFVNQYWELHSKVKDTHHPADNDKNITVKDKEAGEQYILENKPCLSLKEIWSITAEYGLPFVEFEKQIGEYTQQKLKQ